MISIPDVLQISNSNMLGLEGPESHQSGYATIFCLWFWCSQMVTSLVLHDMASLDAYIY